MRTGLVMEGGAMRGMFTAGVIDVFMENNITFDGAIGVSAGAIFGCNMKSKQIGRAIRYNKRFCKDLRFRSYLSLFFTGDLYNAKFCYNTIPNKLDIFDYETFNKSKIKFYEPLIVHRKYLLTHSLDKSINLFKLTPNKINIKIYYL